MNFELRYAGLDAATQQRLRLAANTLAAHRLHARAAEWDGTRCDIVAADPADEYGRRVLEIARRRGTPALELDTRSAESGTTVARLARALYDLLAGKDRAGSASSSDSLDDAGGLVRLAASAELAGKDVEARLGSLVIWLLPASGRVLSATVSDQLRARERLAIDNGWTFTPLSGKARDSAPGEISTSIDAFHLQAAWSARAKLPSFPSREIALKDWPDLGSAAAMVEPLAVVQALRRGHGTVTQIARRTGIAEADVGACLWAFRASGLLQESASRAPAKVAAPPRSAGLFARLATHFGLLRA